MDAARDRVLVKALGEHVTAALGGHDGGAGVLTHGQHAARRDVGVFQKIEGDETVIRGGFRIIENFAELG